METLDRHPRLRALERLLPDEAALQADADGVVRPASAVAALLRPSDAAQSEQLELLLIRRAEREGDAWSGHVALPGGRAEPSDRDLVHTAMRETLEEVGIDLELQTRARLLGALTPLAPRIRRAPALSVHPFVWSVTREVVVTEAPAEVATHHWVSLEQLQDPDRATTHRLQVPDVGTIELPGIYVGTDGSDLLWGMTLQIVTDLLCQVSAADRR